MKELFSKEKWKFLFYTVSHPADGYYEIRHRNRGSVPIAILLVILFSISLSINRMAASFVVNDVDPRSVDSLMELTIVLILYLLICVGNWSITCLMEGEGRIRTILFKAVKFIWYPLWATIISAISSARSISA